MTIAQEEIFGPVLSIIPYDDEEDAVRIANDTHLRPRRRRLVGRRGARQARRAADPHRPGRDQRRRLQPARAVRRLQAVGPRPRARDGTGSRSSSRSSRCSSDARAVRGACVGLLGLPEAPCWDGAGGVYFSDVLRRWAATVVARRRRGGRAQAARHRRHVPARRRRRRGLGARRGARARRRAAHAARRGRGRHRASTTSGRLGGPRVCRRAAVPAVCRRDSDTRVRYGGSTPAGDATRCSRGSTGPTASASRRTARRCTRATTRTGPSSRPTAVFARSPAGSADGLAVDEDGGVWVATGEGGALARFEPDGALDRTVDVPADVRDEPLLRRRRPARRLCDDHGCLAAWSLRRAGPARPAGHRLAGILRGRCRRRTWRSCGGSSRRSTAATRDAAVGLLAEAVEWCDR